MPVSHNLSRGNRLQRPLSTTPYRHAASRKRSARQGRQKVPFSRPLSQSSLKTAFGWRGRGLRYPLVVFADPFKEISSQDHVKQFMEEVASDPAILDECMQEIVRNGLVLLTLSMKKHFSLPRRSRQFVPEHFCANSAGLLV